MAVRIRAMEGENTFQYMSGMNAVSSNWPQTVKLWENIIFHQGADKGSFCCNVYQSNRNFCCYVYETNCDVVYTDEVNEKRINCSELDNYKIKVTVSCVAIKIKTLWNSDEVCFYPDRERTKKYIPDLNEYRFSPVNNGILAKAEIHFLIFERNRGKRFIEKH